MAHRHKSLIPLARDHYEGLLLVQQLRESHRAIMAGWPATHVEQAKFIAQFYDRHLKNHFEAEEQALFPTAIKNVEQARPIVDELLEEHRRIEQSISTFRRPSEEGLAELLKKFGDLLEQHIRKEDRVLFPLLEEHASPAVLDQVEQLMNPYYEE